MLERTSSLLFNFSKVFSKAEGKNLYVSIDAAITNKDFPFSRICIIVFLLGFIFFNSFNKKSLFFISYLRYIL